MILTWRCCGRRLDGDTAGARITVFPLFRIRRETEILRCDMQPLSSDIDLRLLVVHGEYLASHAK